ITLYPTFGDKSTMIKRINLIKQPVATSKAIGIAALLIGSLFTANTALASLVPPPPPKNEVNQATPVMRVDPVYPMEAAKQGIEGSVVLQFDITESGETDNINIVDSFPEGTFDKSAIKALSQWQYKPRIQGGVAQRQTALRVQLDYRLDEDSLKSSTDIEKIKVSAK
ncbi:MAG: energy transducer TonB, partial [Pseudomonadota bacterium]|nr:energy transducer TonB [Pseudomonadota bacterium]